MKKHVFTGLMATLLISCSMAALASPDQQRRMGQYSGFEGDEQALGAEVAQAIMEASPTKGSEHDFTGREKELGLAVGTAIKIMNVESGYKHEMNDALVKMTLNFIQFAKDNDLVDEMITEEIATGIPMMTRVRKVIDKTGNTELALIAVTEQTACFYQLVQETQREPGKITYQSPFGNILENTRRFGMHDLTEQEIHEIWTIPRIEGAGELLGVNLQVSEWQEDGMITISLPDVTVAAGP
jgi:hypothetical protein